MYWFLLLILLVVAGCGKSKPAPVATPTNSIPPVIYKPDLLAWEWLSPISSEEDILSPVVIQMKGDPACFPITIMGKASGGSGELLFRGVLSNSQHCLTWHANPGSYELQALGSGSLGLGSRQVKVRAPRPIRIQLMLADHIQFGELVDLRAQVTDPDRDLASLWFSVENDGYWDVLGEATAPRWSVPWKSSILGGRLIRATVTGKSGFQTWVDRWVMVDYSKGLVGFWPWEDSLENKVSGIVGTGSGVTFVPGQLGLALELPARSSVRVPLRLPASFSWCAWIFVPMPRASLDVCQGGLSVQLRDGFLAVTPELAGGFRRSPLGSTTALPVGSWVHMACVLDQRGMRLLYLNGRLVDSLKEPPYALGTMDHFILGDSMNPQGFLLDDLAVYDRVLSEEEVRLLAGLRIPVWGSLNR